MKKTKQEGCGKQYLVDGEIYIQCGSFIEDNPKKEYFLCKDCSASLINQNHKDNCSCFECSDDVNCLEIKTKEKEE